MKSLLLKRCYVLCILLLTCTFLHAQNLDIIKYNNKPMLTVSGDSAKVNAGGAELITIKLLLEYEKECYNDSTYVIYVVDYTSKPEAKNDTLDLTGLYATIGLYSEKGEWRHKEPTFADFLRWAAKKYGL